MLPAISANKGCLWPSRHQLLQLPPVMSPEGTLVEKEQNISPR